MVVLQSPVKYFAYKILNYSLGAYTMVLKAGVKYHKIIIDKAITVVQL